MTETSRALILAPRGRDAMLAAALIAEIGGRSVVCSDVAALVDELGHHTSFVVVAEEALVRSRDLERLSAWVHSQPSWSDMPFIVLSQRTLDGAYKGAALRISELLGNVILLERPFHASTFSSVARNAIKGRERQWESRASIEALRDSEERLVRLNDTLELRVAERTAELERAHALVLSEIAQREQAEEKLRQGQKLEMIGQLTGGVAHDFNNLLTAIIANLDLLRKRVDDPKALKLIEGACEGAQRGASLTQRLLAFARRQDLKVEPANLANLVRGMTDLIERTIGKDIELLVNLPQNLPPVLVDANQVELALLNLVINARDAMPNGGRLAIELSVLGGQPGLPQNDYVQLAVIDSGHGMSEVTLGKATEPFFSTKGLGKGTGLGLSMVQGLASQLGGALRLSSKLGHGTRAELWLPVTSEPVSEQQPSTKAAGRCATAKMRVLVVDDDPLIAMSTVAMVEDLGHEVLEAYSGDGALELLRSGKSIDLLITDFAMPRMNGAQLAKSARELYPTLPILMATGYAEPPKGFDLDVQRIGKPFRQEQLGAAIADVLRERERV